MRPSLGFRSSKSTVFYKLTTCLYVDNLEFDLFDTGGPQCHFITPVTIRIRTLSVY